MIVLTGGAGFIGSCILKYLNTRGMNDIIVVDRLGTSLKWKNLLGKSFSEYLDKSDLGEFLEQSTLAKKIKTIIHMGACSTTTEADADYLMHNNFIYSKELALWAIDKKINFIYASSGAVYGDGCLGYSDDNDTTFKLEPLNMYGYSKQLFDQWVIDNGYDKKFVGLRFFNVYGPNEYHKQEMMSMVCKGYKQIQTSKKLRLFKSYRPDFSDGEQKRDFVYIKDVLEVLGFFLDSPEISGIFNLGSGLASTCNSLASALFKSMKIEKDIEYVDMPEVLKDKYQYYTCADLSKLRDIGFTKKFLSIDEGVADYVSYLSEEKYF